MLRRALLLLTSLTLVACSSGYQSTVTYTVKMKNSDISGTTIADDEHVKLDDVQWKAFLAAAQAELGEAPKEFEIEGTKLQLSVTQSKNVGSLEQVLKDEGAVFLRATNGVQVDIATFKDIKGTAMLEVDTTGNDMTPVNPSLALSDFKVGLRGSTTQLSTNDFEAAITVTLDVVAY